MKKIVGKVQWGIIGVGDVCEKKSGPAFRKVPDSDMVAVMRRNREKAADYARRHNVPRYYNSANDLIHDPEVNAIYIATPPAYHEEYAMAAMKAGKPVYIEKPVTLNAGECERIIAVSEKTRIPIVVAHYRRRLPLFLKVRELIRSGEIGPVKLIVLRLLQAPAASLISKTIENWRVNPELSGGGLFHDLAPHQLDILCWLFGEPVRFSGSSYNQGKHYPAPDTTFLEAEFNNSVLFNGIWSFNVHENHQEDRCEIFGESGKLSFSFFRDPVLEITAPSGIQKLELPYPEHVQQPLIEEVVRFFKGKTENPCPLGEALWSMRMMDCTLSARNND
jgi:1,5-anhydro-D-fructose reductase (1,5-anhydro-D-mannitol-forming)